LISECVGYALLQPNEPAGEKRIITVYDRGVRHAIVTDAETVQGALHAAGIEIDSHDVTDPTRETKLSESGEYIIIYRSRLVAIVDGSTRQTILTVAQSPNAILKNANLKSLGDKDKAMLKPTSILDDGASATLTIKREKVKSKSQRIVFKPRPDALTAAKGAQVFVDSDGVAHRETYYDLPMNM
jgi:uncharacterized protein YabE (DUF348 family)